MIEENIFKNYKNASKKHKRSLSDNFDTNFEEMKKREEEYEEKLTLNILKFITPKALIVPPKGDKQYFSSINAVKNYNVTCSNLSSMVNSCSKQSTNSQKFFSTKFKII